MAADDAGQAPVLGLPEGTLSQATNLAVTAAALLEQRRRRLDREAWADAEDVARARDRHAALEDPAVRLVNEREREYWWRNNEDQQAWTGANDVETLTVVVGPLPEQRWGLYAQVRPAGGTDFSETEWVHVSYASREAAENEAAALTVNGPDGPRLRSLKAHANAETERYATSYFALHEDAEDRLARVADTVRSMATDQRARPGPWPQEVVNGVLGDKRSAFGALAWWLGVNEVESGIPMVETLRGIDHRNLSEHWVETPAARAAQLIRDGRVEPTVVDGEVVEPDRAAAAAQAAGAAAAGRAQSTAESVITPLLERCLSPATMQAVQNADTYDLLVGRLYERHQRGESLSDLLADVPDRRVGTARDPALYLEAVVANAAKEAQRRSRRAAANVPVEELFREKFGVFSDGEVTTADRVIGCKQFDRLAEFIRENERRGVDVVSLLDHMPLERIHSARKPAAYVEALLDRQIRLEERIVGEAVRHGEHGPRVGSGQAAVHAAAATVEEGRAATEETRAASHRAEATAATDAHSPGTEASDATEAAGEAQVDAQLAAAHRAAAAEEWGAETAAAQRAAVTFTDAGREASMPSRGHTASRSGPIKVIKPQQREQVRRR